MLPPAVHAALGAGTCAVRGPGVGMWRHRAERRAGREHWQLGTDARVNAGQQLELRRSGRRGCVCAVWVARSTARGRRPEPRRLAPTALHERLTAARWGSAGRALEAEGDGRDGQEAAASGGDDRTPGRAS